MKERLLAAVVIGSVIGAVIFHTFYTRNQTQGKPVATNKEVWEWIDWKGRQRKITVYREVKPFA